MVKIKCSRCKFKTTLEDKQALPYGWKCARKDDTFESPAEWYCYDCVNKFKKLSEYEGIGFQVVFCSSCPMIYINHAKACLKCPHGWKRDDKSYKLTCLDCLIEK